jgi:hypothetical protein
VWSAETAWYYPDRDDLRRESRYGGLRAACGAVGLSRTKPEFAYLPGVTFRINAAQILDILILVGAYPKIIMSLIEVGAALWRPWLNRGGGAYVVSSFDPIPDQRLAEILGIVRWSGQT